jgi:dihydropteroate synthase
MPVNFAKLPRPAYIGIVNITPNSFSDGNQFLDPAHAVAHGRDLLAQGAAILDLGAEASSFFRAGVIPTAPDEQLRRLLPVLEQLTTLPNIRLSIDTRSAQVAAECLAVIAGRVENCIINDISAGTHDPAMLQTVSDHKASIILMHISPCYPDSPRENDPDILHTVEEYLAQRIVAARAAGIPHEQIAIDPGVGFGKTAHDNWTLVLRAHELQAKLRTPLVLGCSRKRFLETPPPASLLPVETWQALTRTCSQEIENRKSKLEHPRDPATLALTELTRQRGIYLHRLHILPQNQ